MTKDSAPIIKIFEQVKISELEEKTGLSNTALYKWRDAGHCPANRCEALAKLSKGKVTKNQLLKSIPQIEFTPRQSSNDETTPPDAA